ncbi:MAG: peroxiredoxin [Oscillospiraceae bacterium]|nr:peroxiredoxin [Oscillospiraceae bacterium]
MLSVNTVAPDFSLPDQNGILHSLSDYKGKKVVLYFYPKDNTGGCTKHAKGFSELKQQFDAKNTVILGVSKDSVSSHKNFETKQNLTITLLSDEEKTVISAYDVWHEKKMAGKAYMGVVRTSYLINENGLVIYASDKVKAAENPAQMLSML